MEAKPQKRKMVQGLLAPIDGASLHPFKKDRLSKKQQVINKFVEMHATEYKLGGPEIKRLLYHQAEEEWKRLKKCPISLRDYLEKETPIDTTRLIPPLKDVYQPQKVALQSSVSNASTVSYVETTLDMSESSCQVLQSTLGSVTQKMAEVVNLNDASVHSLSEPDASSAETETSQANDGACKVYGTHASNGLNTSEMEFGANDTPSQLDELEQVDTFMKNGSTVAEFDTSLTKLQTTGSEFAWALKESTEPADSVSCTTDDSNDDIFIIGVKEAPNDSSANSVISSDSGGCQVKITDFLLKKENTEERIKDYLQGNGIRSEIVSHLLKKIEEGVELTELDSIREVKQCFSDFTQEVSPIELYSLSAMITEWNQMNAMDPMETAKTLIERNQNLFTDYADNKHINKQDMFIPHENHPFHGRITKACVPVAQVEKNGTLITIPDLLMYGLPLKKTTSGSVTPPVKTMLDIGKCIYENSRDHRLGVLFGVSGCGKTRAMYHLLCLKFGFYFETYATEKGGSPDLAELQNTLNLELADAIQRGEENRVEDIGTHYINCLILGRLFLLEKVLQRNRDVEPKEWLLLQLHAKKALHIESLGENLLVKVFRTLLSGDKSKVYNELQKKLNRFHSRIKDMKYVGKSNLYILVDEAHVLMNECVNMFSSVTTDGQRSLFSKLFKELNKFENTCTFMAGTAFRLSNGMELVKSCIGKVKNQDDLVFAAFERFQAKERGGSFATENQMTRYMAQFIKAGNYRPNICKIFAGRPRFLAYFIYEALMGTETSAKELVSNAKDRACAFLTGSEEGGLGWALNKLLPKAGRPSERPLLVKLISDEEPPVHVDIWQLLQRMVVACELLGGQLIFPHGAEEERLVDNGICHLSLKNESEPRVTGVQETLVIQAIQKFFDEHNVTMDTAVTDLLTNPLTTPSFKGKLIEYLIPKWISSCFGDRFLGDSPLFQPEGNYNGTPPSWIKKTKLSLEFNGKVSIYDSHRHLDDELEDRKADFILPEDKAKPDLVFFLHHTDRIKRLGFVQSKLHHKPIDISKAVPALQTTDWKNLFTNSTHNPYEDEQNLHECASDESQMLAEGLGTSNTDQMKTGQKKMLERHNKCQKICHSKYHSNTGTLRILFMLPYIRKAQHKPKQVCSQTIGYDAVLVIDRENLHLFIQDKRQLNLVRCLLGKYGPQMDKCFH